MRHQRRPPWRCGCPALDKVTRAWSATLGVEVAGFWFVMTSAPPLAGHAPTALAFVAGASTS